MKFSVIIPTYNRCDILRETVDSVLNQTFSDFELIVVDDGSTDGTCEMLKEYGANLKLLTQKNAGGAKARDIGAEIARGDYLAFLDDDDLFHQNTLEVYSRVIETVGNPQLVLGQPTHFESKTRPTLAEFDCIAYYEYPTYMSKDITLFTSCSMIVVEKNAFRSIGGFGDLRGLKYHLHDDFRFLLKAISLGPVAIVAEPTQFFYRVHKNNSVKNLDAVLNAIEKLVADERAGLFDASGPASKSDRYALIGSTSLYWCKQAIRQGLWTHAIGVALQSAVMIWESVNRYTSRAANKRAQRRTLYGRSGKTIDAAT